MSIQIRVSANASAQRQVRRERERDVLGFLHIVFSYELDKILLLSETDFMHAEV